MASGRTSFVLIYVVLMALFMIAILVWRQRSLRAVERARRRRGKGKRWSGERSASATRTMWPSRWLPRTTPTSPKY